MKRTWINSKYDAYEIKNQPYDPSPILPGRERSAYNSQLGWCTKAVDSLANRLTFEGFENDFTNMWEVFKMNNPDILLDSAITSALISACSFIYVSKDADGEINLQTIDGRYATGTLHPITRMLTEGYAILDVDDQGNPLLEAYFTPEQTEYYRKDSKEVEIIPNPTGYCLLVPVIYRPDTGSRAFGQSRISKDMINIQNHARFTITCMEVAREFGAFPQKYVVGLAQDAEFDTVKNAYKQFLAIDKDADGDKPVVGQFNQISLSSYIAQLETYAKMFSGVSGLTVDDLGFTTLNPSSSQAIKANHSELELMAKKAQNDFSSAFLNVGMVATSLRNETQILRKAFADVRPLWKPVFNMDNSSISSLGDGIIKINQAVPGAIDAKVIKELTGLPINVEE